MKLTITVEVESDNGPDSTTSESEVRAALIARLPHLIFLTDTDDFRIVGAE
jgi:hypothetical protein